MKRTARLAPLLVSVLLAGCGPDLPELEYAIEVVELTSSVFHTGDHLGGPTALEVADGRLFMIDSYADHSLHVVDLETGSLSASVGAIGDGPAEFRSPFAIALDADGRPWVSDIALQRITRIDPAGLEDATAWAAEVLALQNVPYVWDFVWTADNTLFAGGSFGRDRFGILTPDGSLSGVRGTFPPLEREVPAHVLQAVYMPEIASRPDMRAIVSATRWDDRVEIWDADGRLLREVRAPISVTPVVDLIERQGLVAPSFDRSRAAYLSVATTDDHIFALFSARTATEWEDRQLFGRDVHVFDWDGRLVSVLRLDRDALVLTADPEHGRLLTVEFDPVPAVLAYDLPVLPGVETPTRVASTARASENRE